MAVCFDVLVHEMHTGALVPRPVSPAFQPLTDAMPNMAMKRKVVKKVKKTFTKMTADEVRLAHRTDGRTDGRTEGRTDGRTD